MAQNNDLKEAVDKAVQPRAGIRPLPVHLAAVMADYVRNPKGAGDVEARFKGMIAGIQKYQNYAYKSKQEPLKAVWQDGEARLYHCPPENKIGDDHPAILLVPSMINRSRILDLMPQRSFVRWLAAQGCDVFLLDWGNPTKDSGMNDMDGVIVNRLARAMVATRRLAGKQYYALGYCMGGTMLAAGAFLVPEVLKGAIYLAAPWDFHAGASRPLTDYVRSGNFSALQMIGSSGVLPVEWIQSVFAAVNADRTSKKFEDFAAMSDGDAEKLFVAVEDWLNDGIDLPGEIARTCVVDWYTDNLPGQKRWLVAGTCIDPRRLKMPSLVIASASDRLVPQESSTALADILPKASVLSPAIGHIGMMSGKRALKDVWEPVLNWIHKT